MSNTTVVDVVKLVDANKAKLAFLAPLVAAAGAAVASWIVTGTFDAAEIRTAAGGAILAAVSGISTNLANPGRAEISAGPGPTRLR